MTDIDTNSLCTSCGLCCDGTLYSHFNLSVEDNRDVLRMAGVKIEKKEAGSVAQQPCQALKCRSCSIYAHRPQICRDYSCALLDRLGRGEIEFLEAMAITHEAAELKSELLDGISGLGRLRKSVSLNEEIRCSGINKVMETLEGRRENPEILMSLIALNVFLDRHFRKPKSEADDSAKVATKNEKTQ